MGPQRGHIRATNDQIAADNSGHHRSGMPQVIGRTGPSTAGNRNPPVLSRTEEARGSNPLTSTPQQPWSPAWRTVAPGRSPSRAAPGASNGHQLRRTRPTAACGRLMDRVRVEPGPVGECPQCPWLAIWRRSQLRRSDHAAAMREGRSHGLRPYGPRRAVLRPWESAVRAGFRRWFGRREYSASTWTWLKSMHSMIQVTSDLTWSKRMSTSSCASCCQL
jgi:hypothetical protein